MRTRHDTHSSRGFTLVEVLVVVSMMGLVATVIASAIVVFLRSDSSVTNRLTDTRDLQNLANYLPGDVASASMIQVSSIPVTACGGAGSGTPLLLLDWSQKWRDGVTTEFEVTYRESSGQVVRHTCDSSGHREVVVAQRYATIAVSSPEEGTVKVDLTYADGDFRRITASSRNYQAG